MEVVGDSEVVQELQNRPPLAESQELQCGWRLGLVREACWKRRCQGWSASRRERVAAKGCGRWHQGIARRCQEGGAKGHSSERH